ncbi:MAG: hypothetical protein WA802_03085 [Terracidiphilus sp.]
MRCADSDEDGSRARTGCVAFPLDDYFGDLASIEVGRNEGYAENPAPLLHWTVIYYGEVMRSTRAPTTSRILLDFAAPSWLFYPRTDTRIARKILLAGGLSSLQTTTSAGGSARWPFRCEYRYQYNSLAE